MLVSELEERGRRFKIALRAGMPILLLIGLVLYTTLIKTDTVILTTENGFMLAAIIFISIYFIYFLLEQDAVETLLDPDTRCFNLSAFEAKLKTTKSKTIALIVINNLRSINENYGANEANKLLYHSIQRLNQSLEDDGLAHAVIGRRFGAEFLVAIQEKRSELKTSLERFSANNPSINSIEVEYQFSIISSTQDDFKNIIAHLKDELVSSKTYGVKKESETSHELKDSESISKIENEVVSAIERKELIFTFRPLQNAQTDTIDIYEVSVKLRSSDSGDILPRTYLPIVNRLGLGRAYDFSIIEHLSKLLPLIDERISFTFNLSPFSLRNREFQSQLFTFLDTHSIDASRLIIELYERRAHHDLSHYFQTLNYIRSKGFRIAIDNFGSSNASMEYMRHFRFDMVQFDRDYVTKLEDKATYEMLHSLIKMSQNLQIKTVAKWVDKEAQKNKLKALGIDYVQGFGVGKPISEKVLIDTYN